LSDLGEYHQCLKVADLETSIAFYQKMGLELVEDQRHEKWAVLRHNNLILALYEGHIQRNLLNFRGGDIAQIAEELADDGVPLHKPAREEADGSWSAEVVDPDGNVIYFNTDPAERTTYLKTGRLLGH